jgi:hypothetical protein
MARRRRSEPPRPVVPIGDGGVELHLSGPERQLLQSLLSQVRLLIRSELAGPLDESSTIRRLFPTAYAQDPDREEAYQAVSRDELVESKLAGVDLVEDTLDSEALDADQAQGWLRALNDVRLVLGTRLDVSEDTAMVDPEHPQAALYVAYDYLGFLVDSLVEALTGSLPPIDED